MFWRKKKAEPVVEDNDRATRLAWGFTLEDWLSLSDDERKHARTHVARALARD